MNSDPRQPDPITYPELVVGIAGPIGVDMDMIASSFGRAFKKVSYASTLVKLTEEMQRYSITDRELLQDVERWRGDDTFNTYMRQMSAANALRKQYKDTAVLAPIGINALRRQRSSVTGNPNNVQKKHVYIIRQLKRPEEVFLLRKVYQWRFVLASAYASEANRREQLCDRLRRELSTASTPSEIGFRADQLIERDASEDQEALGQQLRDTFHLADIFIDGLDKPEMDKTTDRFVQALFGRNDIAPSKDEYGMYAARSASLRSSDLSTQVGAAVFSCDGELITQGCNEVPKAFGGTYWDLEEPDHRDVKKGYDPNEHFKRELLRDVVERLKRRQYLTNELLSIGNDAEIVSALIAKEKDGRPGGALAGSRITDLTEYGRVVHAEMLAICDAARIGRSVKNATLYCTTFPCHNCTKHILASGIRRVVYMEPYPKSRAKDLHPDEIEAESSTKVSFVPFIGISPFRYRDIFQKGRRKQEDGEADEWYNNQMRPMVELVVATCTYNEEWALADLIGNVRPKD
jgi:deoxycytidylate deaminase